LRRKRGKKGVINGMNIVIVRLYKGKGFISSLIKWQSRGEYSHAAVIAGGVLYEAKEFEGLRKRMAVDENKEYDDFLVETTKEQRDILIKFLEEQMGKKYDYSMVIRFITRQQEQRASTGRWFCSELCYAALRKAGIPLFNLTEPWEVSPDDLKRSILMKKLS
jgi:uncharacterized protein YycO